MIEASQQANISVNMDKTSQVLKSLEKMAEKEFVPLLRIMSECLKMKYQII
ncbi:MAG TPA: hypothetical protein VKA09_07245 [Nitrososphaeraceae archaeon]|nr:hypothetical protein [Nitrososphaeraceae archaeon]